MGRAKPIGQTHREKREMIHLRPSFFIGTNKGVCHKLFGDPPLLKSSTIMKEHWTSWINLVHIHRLALIEMHANRLNVHKFNDVADWKYEHTCWATHFILAWISRPGLSTDKRLFSTSYLSDIHINTGGDICKCTQLLTVFQQPESGVGIYGWCYNIICLIVFMFIVLSAIRKYVYLWEKTGKQIKI